MFTVRQIGSCFSVWLSLTCKCEPTRNFTSTSTLSWCFELEKRCRSNENSCSGGSYTVAFFARLAEALSLRSSKSESRSSEKSPSCSKHCLARNLCGKLSAFFCHPRKATPWLILQRNASYECGFDSSSRHSFICCGSNNSMSCSPLMEKKSLSFATRD